MADQSMTPAEIYHQVTGGQGMESLAATQKCAKDLSARLIDRVDEIARLVKKVRAGWHGVSAEAAANSASPLMAAAADHSANLVFAQTAADAQMSAFQTVKNTVKPIGDRPEITAQDVYDLLNGKPGYFARLDQWQADAQHNIDAYTCYHSTTRTNSDRIPARYAELSGTDASVRLASTSAPRKPVAGPGGASGKPPDGRQPGVVEPPPGAARPVGPVPEPREPRPGTGSHEEKHPGSRAPDATESRPSTVLSEPAARPDSTGTSSYRPSSPVLPPGYQFGPSGQPTNPLGTSVFEPGPGGLNGTNGGLGAGNRFGARGPGEQMPARGGRAGSPGAAGKPGSMLGGGIPGKSKENDKEKTAPPYLRETDPDVFGGSDLKPTPPVIGDRPAR
ncbi:PPE family protein [Amycolatopsis echigonensis]|uniref:PPE family protein n=1 Tax=Amycolatopsis echigonensis TaxID=2576905 RepID=A0A2N3WKC1_9PSEU|nr:PPE domain-containing protein [Amycolatopsis niigatensis]PKV94307.1 PPE family protein [Amycolatopsis niigatensis]